MKTIVLADAVTSQLVARFVELNLALDAAEQRGENAKYNRLFEQMMDVVNELKARAGDQRIHLVPLHRHPNIQVRMQAAKLTLAVAPDAARAVLQSIFDSGWQPQSLSAGMCLLRLDRGEFKPT
jgi:hypothetical protein